MRQGTGRLKCWCVLLMVSSVAAVEVSSFAHGGGHRAASAAQGNDYSKVEVKATHVAGNVHMLQGAGGNIGVSAGPDGVLIVDDQYAPLADKIRAALAKL